MAEGFGEMFGSVLADLPKEVFDKIRSMKDVVFIFLPTVGAEIKVFRTEIRRRERLRIVIFPYTSMFQPPKVIRGEIAHELAHIFLEEYDFVHEPGVRYEDTKVEHEADQTAIDWGFEEEIRSFRDYIEKLQRRK